MKAREFHTQVEHGIIPPFVRSAIADLISQLEGKRIVISVALEKKRRSSNQNRYYWGVVVETVREMFLDAGNDVDAEEVHEYLKEHVGKLSKIIIDPAGHRRVVVRSSAGLSKAEFEEFMERVRA